MHLTPQEKIFNEIFPICEEQAMRGDYIHSPSAFAKKLTLAAIIGTLSIQQKAIYDCIKISTKTTKEINIMTGLATKNIAAICINMEKMGILKSTITNKKKIWKASI